MDIASTLRSLLLSNPNSTSTLLSTLPANTLDLIKLASSNSEMANLFNNPVSQINNRDVGSIPPSKLSGKEVTCEICGKKLSEPASLYRHRKIHTGDKPHKCPYCDKRFIQRYNMKQHIKTHRNESDTSEKDTDTERNDLLPDPRQTQYVAY